MAPDRPSADFCGAEVPGEIPLHGGADGLNQVLGTGGRGARHLEDVAGEHQAPDVGADERHAQLTAVAGQDVAERREDERAEDVPEQLAGAVVGQARPENRGHLLADLRALLPQTDKPPDQLFSGPVTRVGEATVFAGGWSAAKRSPSLSPK